jgi:hypothetical protein
MPDSSSNRLDHYFARGRNRVDGWFGRIDAEIFRALLSFQISRGLRGSLAEIGVHHGKSFIGLCHSLQEGESAYCIDIFDNQTLNIDASGKGDRAAFEKNLRRFGVNLKRLTIRSVSSLEVSASEIVNQVGPVRFFSIDGGHWDAIVKNDLKLAEASLAEYGVVALDDFHRPEWPDVSAGYFSWMLERKTSLAPFCIGFNKLYLCNKDWRQPYQNVILNDAFLQHFITKMAKLQDVELPVFSEFPLPEEHFWRRRRTYMRLYRPAIYVQLRRLRRFSSRILRPRP